MLRATASLEREHRTIERVLRAIDVLADELAENRQIDAGILEDLCQFLWVYANQCHQSKEESYLFSMLKRRGVPEEGCPLGSLRHEHEQARALVHALIQAVAAYPDRLYAGRPALMEVFRRLAEFYSAHIWKEEYLLFPMAEKVLSEADDERLLVEFASVESDISSSAHESYEHMATELEKRVMLVSPKMRSVA